MRNLDRNALSRDHNYRTWYEGDFLVDDDDYDDDYDYDMGEVMWDNGTLSCGDYSIWDASQGKIIGNVFTLTLEEEQRMKDNAKVLEEISNELNELDTKATKLAIFLEGALSKDLSKPMRALENSQLRAMQDYKEALEARIELMEEA